VAVQRVPTIHKIVKTSTAEGRAELAYAERPRNLTELLGNTVSKHSNDLGPMDENARLTYQQFALSVSNVSYALHVNHGVTKGDRVALMLRNGLEFAISLFAIARVGATTVPLNTGLRGEEVAYQLEDSGATTMIMEPEFHELLAETSSGVRGVKQIFVTGSKPPAGAIAFSELLEDGESLPIATEVAETDAAVILYTSGTTGQSKGALLSHKGIIASALNVARLYSFSAKQDRMLVVAPLFHIAGLSHSLIAAVYAGLPFMILKRFKPVGALEALEKERITTMTAVPTIYWLLLNAPEFDQRKLGSLRLLSAGGAPVPDDLVKVFAAKLPGVQFAPGYGLTEACGMTHTTINLDETLKNPSSVGRVVPVMDAKVVDGSGRELPPGEKGEILVKGCQVMKGYWNNAAATQETIVDGWLHTGDIGSIAEDGHTYIFDRMKDVIIRGGENIYCLEIENVLYQNPKVLEVAVVGVPDLVFGEQVKAAIVLKPGENAEEEEIREFCGQYLAYYKVPKYVEFREALPRNSAGKVIKSQLK
jgi:long-chain acyl-CoA synthetase